MDKKQLEKELKTIQEMIRELDAMIRDRLPLTK